VKRLWGSLRGIFNNANQKEGWKLWKTAREKESFGGKIGRNMRTDKG